MFNTHQKKIGVFAQTNPENMARVYQFVLATIQQNLNQTPDIMGDIDNIKESSKYLFGFKQRAWNYSQDNMQGIFDTTMRIHQQSKTESDAEHALLLYFAGLPGLGVVKGGFMIQLCFGLSGCIDSHNIKRFDLNSNTFSAARFKNAKTDKLRNKIISDYHKLVNNIGGCETLWNSWCEYVADRNNNIYGSGYDVSALHVSAILPQ